jgi:hypothetical protein
MWFGILTLATALIISVSAAYYSILGLTAIFASAFWPIVILGSSLEVGKIVSTLWLHKYWDRAELQYKAYLCSAVAILMVLTSMGVFGFLSKAHLDQAVPSGDIQAQVQIYDDKIKTQRDNIEAARKALRQMDEAVDQTMSRSSTEQGADKAASLRRSQARERGNLQNDISRAQGEIVKLQEARAPVASQARQVEAEVGPIKYIAALIYGDNPDTNLLEKAVRWVIILIVIVFDPLALTLLLAATKTFEWERENQPKDTDEDPDVRSWFDQARERARFWDQQPKEKSVPWPFPREFEGVRINGGEWQQTGPEIDTPPKSDPEQSNKESVADQLSNITTTSQLTTVDEFFVRDQTQPPAVDVGAYEPPEDQPVKKKSILSGLDSMWSHTKKLVIKDSESDHAPITEVVHLQDKKPGFTNKIRNAWDNLSDQISTFRGQSTEDQDTPEKIAERAWKAENPHKTLKRQRVLFKDGKLDQLPWNLPEFRERTNLTEINTDFGKDFPDQPNKGDMFLKTDRLPSTLYKFNGSQWITVDKDKTDSYSYNTAYVDYLIEKIASGEYDPELLSEGERISIETRLNQTS